MEKGSRSDQAASPSVGVLPVFRRLKRREPGLRHRLRRARNLPELMHVARPIALDVRRTGRADPRPRSEPRFDSPTRPGKYSAARIYMGQFPTYAIQQGGCLFAYRGLLAQEETEQGGAFALGGDPG